MDKIEKYQNLIVNFLEQQVAPYQNVVQGEVQEQVIIDTQHHYIQWLTIGWDEK